MKQVVNTEKTQSFEVSYVGDFDGPLPPETLILESDRDYVLVCNTLSNEAQSTASVRVWVHRRNHFSWLRDFAKQTRIPLSFAEKTARSILGDLWHVSVPDWVTDESVLQERLLGIEVSSEYPSSFEERILVHFFGKIFEDEVLNHVDLAKILSGLGTTSARRKIEQYPSLRRSLESKCALWQAKAKEPWLKNLCSLLVTRPEETWKELTCLALLHGYPHDLLEFVVPPDRIPLLRSVPATCTTNMTLHSQGVDDAINQIDVFFNDVKKQIVSNSDFQKVLARVSGRTLQEFDHLREVLQSGGFSPEQDVIQAFQERFRGCTGLTEAQLRNLQRFVIPAKPSLKNPGESWTAQQWVDWAVKEYFPYRYWQTACGHYDEELEGTVKAFSDWYTSEYVTVQHDSNLSLLNCLQNVAPESETLGLSVILLIDCLPVSFYGLLDGAMRDAGFSRHDLEYRFAPLPTSTEYSKPRLLKGSWDVDEKDYRKVLEARSKNDWASTPVVYLSKLKDLAKLKPAGDSSIVLLNLTTADELFHRDLDSENLTHEDEVGRLFVRLVDAVRSVICEWHGDCEHVCVHVVTDHGASRILDEEKTTLDSAILGKLFDDEKHRFARIHKSDAHQVPDNLWALGCQFKNPFIEEECVYFVPRGHNTVKPHSKTIAYTHGGATPEEVLVPCGLYRPVKASWKRPDTRFISLTQDERTGRAQFYIQRVVTIELELYNPNPVEIRLLRASVTHPDNELKDTSLPKIPGEQRDTVRLDCYFRKTALGERDMELEIVYEIAGDTKTLELVLPSEFRSAMSGGFSLKNL